MLTYAPTKRIALDKKSKVEKREGLEDDGAVEGSRGHADKRGGDDGQGAVVETVPGAAFLQTMPREI